MTLKLGYNKLGYNKLPVIAYIKLWLDPTYLKLLSSWLLRTPLITNKFGQPQAVCFNRVSLYVRQNLNSANNIDINMNCFLN